MADVNPSTALARVLVDELIACGIADVVLSPGSRNAPLSMALHDADAAGRLRLHVRIDERTAGFLALGLARGSGRPAAVVTTSGTAVGNLHPAVLEAHHGAVPVLVLTADRPPEFRDVGANQTIDQRLVFGGALRFFHEFAVAQRVSGQNARWRSMVCRAVAAAAGRPGPAGPVQLNLPFADPLLPDPDGDATDDWPEPLTGRAGPWTTVVGTEATYGPAVPAPEPGERVLFLADLSHPWAAAVADAGHLVVSEAGGGAGSGVLAAGMHLLDAGDFLDAAIPDRVIVLGRPTLFRQVQRLLGNPRVTVDVIAHPQNYADPPGSARSVAAGWPDLRHLPDEQWCTRWRAANAAAALAVRTLLDAKDINSSPRLARDLLAALPSRATLVVGSSQSPRDIASASAARSGVRLVANRGVAGIDGSMSTAVGVALAAGADDGPTYALLGDLTAAHDITGLVIGPHEPRPDLTIVVSNNDGGAIFSTLEPGQARHSSAFDRVFGTPHGVLFAGLVEGCGAEHILVSTADELADAIAGPAETGPVGIRVVEVPTSRTDLAATAREMKDAVRAAI